jgi:hypothetical protein
LAGVAPALQRDPPAFVVIVLFVFFVSAVSPFTSTADHADFVP